MKKIMFISIAIIAALSLMSFTESNERHPFDDSKAVYSGPCGNYSVDVNTLVKMYYMLPTNIRKDLDSTFAQYGDQLFDGSTCYLYGVKLVGVRNHETDNYDYTITYLNHTIKVNNIDLRDVV